MSQRRPAGAPVEPAACETKEASTLRRGLAVLELLSGRKALESGGFGVVRIARELHEDKSQISRTLKTLALEGFVDRDPTSLTYRLSWKLYVMGIRASSPDLVSAGARLLPHLSQLFGEQTHLSVLRDGRVLVLHSERPPRSSESHGFVGQTASAITTASGRAMLLDHSRDSLAKLLRGLDDGATESTNRIDEVWRAILVSRRPGYVIAENEVEPGISSAAAPIRDRTGKIVAAIGCYGPTERMHDRLESIAQQLRQAATLVTGRLG